MTNRKRRTLAWNANPSIGERDDRVKIAETMAANIEAIAGREVAQVRWFLASVYSQTLPERFVQAAKALPKQQLSFLRAEHTFRYASEGYWSIVGEYRERVRGKDSARRDRADQYIIAALRLLEDRGLDVTSFARPCLAGAMANAFDVNEDTIANAWKCRKFDRRRRSRVRS